MRAIVLQSHGGPEVLTPMEVPDPDPGPEEVLVEVAATAVNRADLLQRMGLYPGPPMVHEIPGLEFAGRVVEVGARAGMWQPGDEVMGIVGGGAYAERLVVHERQAMAVPAGMGLGDAAAIPEVFITAYDALVLQGGLGAGGWALVHAGASGVGTAAIQLARAVGARIAVTCSAGKMDACRALGADVVVDRSAGDFVAEVSAATGGSGVDVVLDVVGGDYLARNVRAAAVGGRIVQVGVMGGGTAEAPLGEILSRRIHLLGTVLRARPVEEKIAVSRRCAHDLLPLFESGVLRPVVDREVSLWDVAAAHEHVAANANVGKVVLAVD
jgi:putative PIG3 family NAD(P)H quinone oxidoreductase